MVVRAKLMDAAIPFSDCDAEDLRVGVGQGGDVVRHLTLVMPECALAGAFENAVHLRCGGQPPSGRILTNIRNIKIPHWNTFPLQCTQQQHS